VNTPVPEEETQAVGELGPGDGGRWLITTRTSEHVLDLDAWTYWRRPGPGAVTAAADVGPLRLLRVPVWPQVGGYLYVWYQDPDRPDLQERWHRTATIARIEAMAVAGDDSDGR